VRPVSDVFLLSVAEIAATLIGLLLVGAFFYVETGLRRLGRAREAATSYLRAGTRIVLVLYGMTLALSLSLVALESIWTRVFFAVLSLLLLAANVATSLRIRALAKLTRSRAVLVNDVVSSAGILALVAIPWVLGGLHPTREDLTWAILLSLATGFLCTGTLVLSVFGLSKMEAAARPRVGLVPRAKLGDLPKNRDAASGTWGSSRADARPPHSTRRPPRLSTRFSKFRLTSGRCLMIGSRHSKSSRFGASCLDGRAMAGLTWRQDRDQFLMLVQTESGCCLRPSSPRRFCILEW
jgi:hypothetical protein